MLWLWWKWATLCHTTLGEAIDSSLAMCATQGIRIWRCFSWEVHPVENVGIKYWGNHAWVSRARAIFSFFSLQKYSDFFVLFWKKKVLEGITQHQNQGFCLKIPGSPVGVPNRIFFQARPPPPLYRHFCFVQHQLSPSILFDFLWGAKILVFFVWKRNNYCYNCSIESFPFLGNRFSRRQETREEKEPYFRPRQTAAKISRREKGEKDIFARREMKEREKKEKKGGNEKGGEEVAREEGGGRKRTFFKQKYLRKVLKCFWTTFLFLNWAISAKRPLQPFLDLRFSRQSGVEREWGKEARENRACTWSLQEKEEEEKVSRAQDS